MKRLRQQPVRPGWMPPCDCHMLPLPTHLGRALLLAEGWTAVLIFMALTRARRKR